MSQTNGETTSFFRQALGLCGKDVPMSKAAEGVVPEGMMFVQRSCAVPGVLACRMGRKKIKQIIKSVGLDVVNGCCVDSYKLQCWYPVCTASVFFTEKFC